MKTSPTQRSLKHLRSEGWLACIVEKWNQHAFIRVDAFGFGDLLAVSPNVNGAMLVQTTSGSNMAARVAKILEIDAARVWIKAGNRIEVHGWRKSGAKGKRKLWNVRTVVLTEEDFMAHEAVEDPYEVEDACEVKSCG